MLSHGWWRSRAARYSWDYIGNYHKCQDPFWSHNRQWALCESYFECYATTVMVRRLSMGSRATQ